MFDRLEKPFLTVETGEAYQPLRMMYEVSDIEELVQALEKMQCIQKNTSANSWTWYWKAECDDIHFESLESFRKSPTHAVRLGTMSLRNNKFYINLPSFKRACLAVPFFHKTFSSNLLQLRLADFINKVFALDERLPHGFTEMFKEDELDKIIRERITDYNKVKENCERAETAEEALTMLSDFTHAEAKKRLPYAERYTFDIKPDDDSEVIFLAFYIFLRSRELVAIRRWYGQAGYSLADAVDETVDDVFGSMGLDILE